jgi:flagellin
VDSTGVNTAVTATGTTTNGAATADMTTAFSASNLTVATGDLTIKLGANGAVVDLAGTYKDGAALADAINNKVGGAYASYDSTAHTVTLMAGDDITLGGTKYGAGAGNFGFAAATATVASDTSFLDTVDVKSTEKANETMLRVDAALNSVSTLRSTLGAIQNRFQSTINSLSSVSENLSASRSRILDTDFAAETANLTRAQILQQAGTAMVAQANSVPQNVLSLLRG